MRRRFVIILLFLLWVGCSREPEPNGLKCKVIKIVDGDTIDVLDKSNKLHRIRLQGIDAPEDGQAFGTLSTQHLNELLYGRDIVLQGKKVDRYRRMVCKVLVDGRDANLEQVVAGLAWFYRKYENELSWEDRQIYSTSERQAQHAKIGLWSDPLPTPPWEYRPANGLRSSPLQQARVSEQEPPKGSIVGNRRSRIYHWPGCPDYEKIAPHNREHFNSREEAEKEGYIAAGNCDN